MLWVQTAMAGRGRQAPQGSLPPSTAQLCYGRVLLFPEFLPGNLYFKALFLPDCVY